MQTAQLTSHEVFQFLRPEQINAISSAAEELSLKSGDVVFERGEPAEGFVVVLEGQVALRLPRPEGVNLLINEVTVGGIFGSCVCFQINTYTLSATCSTDARILKIEASTLKKLMDDDPLMGYAIQTLVSRVYFKRYIDTMQKLQAIVQSIPLEAA
ncbi:MAG: cyclic nucleotide-binding domain-containing protein [Acidobacteriota bacterium]